MDAGLIRGFSERWYQSSAADSVIPFFSGSEGNPIIVAPTGSGKTIIVDGIVRRFHERYPGMGVLVLCDITEVLGQLAEALRMTRTDVAVWSASLGEKKVDRITVAGIASVHRKADLFRNVGLIVIDEAHMVNHNDKGMYRKFLANFQCAKVGLTATPFRLGHGYIYSPEGSELFDCASYDLGSTSNFNRLVAEGYLARLISRRTDLDIDIEGVRTVAGDFDQRQLSICVDRIEITNAACQEIVRYGKNYKKWLIFAIDIEHAEHIASTLNGLGIPTGCLHSKAAGRREVEIERLRSGEYRALVNVEMLTTGFDVREIDLIAMLRPTKSPVIHVQTIGRGLRPVYAADYDLSEPLGRLEAQAKGVKPHCLVLDFAGNTKRIGPINAIEILQRGEKKKGAPVVKECPDCQCLHHGSVRFCDVCGHEFKFQEKIRGRAEAVDVVREESPPPEWVRVSEVRYRTHSPAGKKPSLRVTYVCGMLEIDQWVCIDHEGYAKHLAKHWVKINTPDGIAPAENLAELFARRGELKKATWLMVKKNGKYHEIQQYRWD